MTLPEQVAHVDFMCNSSRWNLSLEDRAALLAVVVAYQEMFALVRESRDYAREANLPAFPDKANTARLLAEMNAAVRRGFGQAEEPQSGSYAG